MVLLVVVLGPRPEFEIQVVPGSEYEIQVGTGLRFGFTIGGPFWLQKWVWVLYVVFDF